MADREEDGAWLDPWKGSFCGGGGGAWEEEAEEERESGGAEGKEGGGPGKKGGLVLLLLRATGGGGGKSMVLLSGGTVFNIPLLTTQTFWRRNVELLTDRYLCIKNDGVQFYSFSSGAQLSRIAQKMKMRKKIKRSKKNIIDSAQQHSAS